MRSLVVGLILLAVVGCDRPTNIHPIRMVTPQPSDVALGAPERIEVVSVQQFNDGSAYTPNRTVLVLRDRKTGREYLAIQGYGVTSMEYAGTPGKGGHPVEP